MSKVQKRKRIVGSQAVKKRARLQNSQPVEPTTTTVIRSDALKWREARLPDRLEDAEGFYGLEEIDDVEIIKNSQTGQITFRTLNVEDKPSENSTTNSITNLGEWNGFEDAVENKSDREQNKDTAAAAASSGSAIVTKAKQSSKNKKKDAVGEHSHDVQDGVDFRTLDNVNEDTSVDISAWRSLLLSDQMLSTIANLGYSDPTPIQIAAIPPILNGHDIVGKAVTGSGKTLAFGIPIIENWLSIRKGNDTAEIGDDPLAFILAPTRELAHQLAKHLTALCEGLDQAPRIATVTGGLSVMKQQRQLERADIIIGTPGRLWEVINDSHGLLDRLKRIKFLVMDEADRLLSNGHFKEVEEILSVLDRKVIAEDGNEAPSSRDQQSRQTLVFSATFQQDLQQKLAGKQKWQSHDSNLLSNMQSLEYLLRKLKFQKGSRPTFVDANPTSQMADNLSESILECGAMQKDLYLYSLLLLRQQEHAKSLRLKDKDDVNKSRLLRTLVFTNSISTVKRLVPLLTSLSLPSTTVLPLHSTMPQKSRLRSLERFAEPIDKHTSFSVLIATDVAARGLDIKGIDSIVHYHVPRAADTYVHRSGRTARSTASGRSILICSPEEVVSVTRLISKVHADKAQGRRLSLSKATVHPMYLPANLPQQLQHRLTLAQKITSATLDTSKTNSDSNFLRTAAEELGVDYNSDEFDDISSKNRRGRGGGREKKRKENVQNKAQGKVEGWKAELKADLKGRSVDFGDGEAMRGKFLAGGAFDVERLLKERGAS